MRTLVVEHDPLSTAERVGAHLEKRGANLESFVVVEDIADPAVTATFPEDPYDLVVLMGSPWSVYEERVQGWVGPELDFVRRRLAAGVPMFGICFGAQTMSAALGGKVTHAVRPEYGWTEVGSATEHIAEGPWFQFHHDEFTVPPGAIELARNESGVQSFRAGRGLAVQFHPEMTADLLASWCRVEGGVEELVEAGLSPDDLIGESRLQEIESQPALETLLDWFLDEVAGEVR
ncbi:MAG: type 1 glutamine amidotransferase [Acidimicrobiia bacterium]